MTELHPSSRRFENLKILYVDDEADNLEAFELHYEDQFEIVSFTDPEKALEQVKRDPDLAVLLIDQVMPKMTGLEFATQAKRVRPTLTCIMITGNATKKLAIESIRTRLFWEFLEKPVDFGAAATEQLLVNAISEHLLSKVKHEYHQGTVQLLANLIDDKDGHTRAHSARVTKWSMKVGKKFNLSERELIILREGALLHDIGKISIPDDILKKPGRLSELERKIIQTHPGRGGQLLDKVPQLKEMADIARYHHERPDGKGYPEGLAGEQIPLLAQIVAIADFFEALNAKRPYKDPWPIEKIVAEIISVRGQQFSEPVVDALFEVLEEEGLIEASKVEELRQAAA